MVDLQRLLPHAKKELNKTGKTNMDTINEVKFDWGTYFHFDVVFFFPKLKKRKENNG